jgi:hypothetical protein
MVVITNLNYLKASKSHAIQDEDSTDLITACRSHRLFSSCQDWLRWLWLSCLSRLTCFLALRESVGLNRPQGVYGVRQLFVARLHGEGYQSFSLG